MTQLFTTFKSIALLASTSILVTGCLGGSIAQQVARSIATSVADNAVANAMDVQELDTQDRFGQNKKYQSESKPVIQPNPLIQTTTGLQENSNPQQNLAFQQSLASQQIAAVQKYTESNNGQLDLYRFAFNTVKAEEPRPIEETLPSDLTEVETPYAVIQSNQLVTVELFNLLIGEEKAAVYTKAQLLGSISLPKQKEWKSWRVATGVIKIATPNLSKTTLSNQTDSTHSRQIITFLIPPEFGKLASGSVALVEIASPGELNIARYKIN